MDQTERALVLAGQIQELRRRLEVAEKEFRGLIHGEPRGDRRPVKPEGTIGERLIAVLVGAGESRTTDQLIEAVSPVGIKTVRSTLARLAKEGRVERDGRGIYRAKK